ncbi:pirin family protein [Dermatophilaceae bacterium Soc4.6]
MGGADERVLLVLDGVHAWISPRSEVLRLLPHRERRMVGAWCFVDLFGPRPVADGEAMHVPPHPHTGLQTVSWLASGRVRHRDALGSVADVVPGRVAVMTAGDGIAHAEDVVVESADSEESVLHGAQLWVALPESERRTPRTFTLHEPAPQAVVEGVRVSVFAGDLAGVRGPQWGFTPLMGVELVPASAGGGGEAVASLRLDAAYEHLLAPMAGEVTVDGVTVGVGQGLFWGTDRASVQVTLSPDARVLLLGGAPFDEEIVMWWNFVARTHDEVVAARDQWNAGGDPRFGEVDYPGGERLAAPPMPSVRLRPRGRRR